MWRKMRYRLIKFQLLYVSLIENSDSSIFYIYFYIEFAHSRLSLISEEKEDKGQIVF